MRLTREERLTYWRIQGVSGAVGSLAGLAAGCVWPTLAVPVAFGGGVAAGYLQIWCEKRKLERSGK